jgi:hypothetical protein
LAPFFEGNELSTSFLKVFWERLQASEMDSLSTRFAALHSFVVSTGVLMDKHDIPANAFFGATSLPVVKFLSPVSVGINPSKAAHLFPG